MDRYLKRRSRILADCPQKANALNSEELPRITSDSGVKNLNTKTNTNASGTTDDTFDDELDIDVEELDRVMHQNKGPADEGFEGTRVANDDDFNLRFSSQTTTTIEPPQRVVEGDFTLRWAGSPDDSQTSTGKNDQNEETFSEEINSTNSEPPKKRRSGEPHSIYDYMYEEERLKIAEHVARSKNQNGAVPIQTQSAQNIVENTPEDLPRPPRPVHSQMPRPGKAARSSSLSDSILRPRDSTLVGLGNSKGSSTKSVTSLLNELNSSTTHEKTKTISGEIITNANNSSTTSQVTNPIQSTINATVNLPNPEINAPITSTSTSEEERPVVNSANADPIFRVPAVPPKRNESSSGTKERSSEETTSAHPNSTSSSSNSKSSGVGRTITTSSTGTSSYGTPTPQSQKSVCIYRSKNSLAVAVFDDERQTILWSENKLQAVAKNDQVDNLLLPLLFEHEPRFLVVCGNKEDALLSALLKVSKQRFAAADYRPPQLIRLDNSEFFAPKCQARIRESMRIERGSSIHTRCAIPSDCTIAIRSVGALIGFIKRANTHGPIKFEPLSLVTACGIDSNVLRYLRITNQRGQTSSETTLLTLFRGIKGIGLQKRLRRFLQTPVADIDIIKRRQAIFEFFAENGYLRRDLLMVCERFSIPKKISSGMAMAKSGLMVRKNYHFWKQVLTAVRNISEVQISRQSIPAHIKGLKISAINEDLFKRIQDVGSSIENLIDLDQESVISRTRVFSYQLFIR